MIEIRTGIGTDVHQLSAGVPMHVAGLSFPDETVGLVGHSDGDVACHAICDALLSATGLGDIGSIFGTADPQWAGAAGVALLGHVVALVTGEDQGFLLFSPIPVSSATSAPARRSWTAPNR